jgi:hypothetical protein
MTSKMEKMQKFFVNILTHSNKTHEEEVPNLKITPLKVTTTIEFIMESLYYDIEKAGEKSQNANLEQLK